MAQTLSIPESVETALREVEKFLSIGYKPDIPIIGLALSSVFGAGGKRLRPSLVLLCHDLFAPPHPAGHRIGRLHRSRPCGLTASRRRGGQCLHAPGPPFGKRRLGNKVAVMLADFLLTRVLADLSTPENVQALGIVSNATSEMAAGQLREIQYQMRFDTTEEEYLTLIREKTGALIEASCHIGALAAGASPERVSALVRYGHQLGLAYQITDDCLDYWGDPARLGKPVGSDLGEGKVTLPLIRTLESCSPDERRLLVEKLGADVPDAQVLSQVLDLMDRYAIQAKSMALAHTCHQRALAALENLPDTPARAALAAWADYTVERQN